MNDHGQAVKKIPNASRVLLVRSPANEADWLRARAQNGIGASESPIICGLSPYGSIVELYGRKVGLLDVQDETEAMKWGKKLEPLVLEEYVAETGRQVMSTQVLVQSVAHPYLIATPDAEQTAAERGSERGVVEIKTTRLVADWAEAIPPRVWAQMQHQMAVTGHSWGTAVALLGGSKLVWADVERDDAYIHDVLIPRCQQFWSCVENRDPIPTSWIDGSDATTAALKQMFPERLEGEVVDLDAEFFDVHANLQELKTTVAQAEVEVKRLENQIKLAIGEKTFGRLPNGTTYSYRTQSRAEHVVKASTFRVLRLVKGSVS